MTICPSCGTENPDGFNFCGNCGTKLIRAAITEERKVVTIVFFDLVMFTQRSETLDPEDVRSFLLPYYDLVSEEIARHGGTIDKFLGDGVMAVFGAPIAHEDDPERAVRASLRVLERIPELGLDLHARIGINTGEVVVAAAAFERSDAITGDAANTASRLQARAPIDGIVVGELTHRATSHLFDYEVLDDVAVKGKAEPVRIFRPIAPLARESAELVDDAIPFVGRDLELSILIQLLDRSRMTPSTGFITIVAEPGIGKSRLVRELARHVGSLPERITWRQGRCLPYGEAISFGALGEIVKSHAGILDTDDQATLSSKLDQVLVESDRSLRSWMKTRLAPLVGLETPAEPPQLEEAFTAWRRFLEQIAEVGPTVVVVEDLHWASDEMVAFLRHIAERTAGAPLFVIATARPEVEERHPTWLGRARRSTVLHLDALADKDMTTLIEATLEGTSPELVGTILERAGGSPLYAEQLAAMAKDRALPIVEGSVDEAAIPPTIQALLAARIDLLSQEMKSLLLDASVVGKTFWLGALAALSSRDPSEVKLLLTELTQRDFIQPVVPTSMAGDSEFSFVHALMRDVAYAKLPRSARMTRHRDTAGWVAERAGVPLGGHAEVVAEHYGRALQLAEAVGATNELAPVTGDLMDALLAAARYAMGTQPTRGVTHLARALELLAPADPRRPEVLALYGRALGRTFDINQAVTTLEEATDLFRARGDLVAAAELAAPLSGLLLHSGEAGRGSGLLAEARSVLQDDPGPGLVAVIAKQADHAMAAYHDELARSFAEEAIALASELELPPPSIAMQARGVVRFPDDPDGGEADLRIAIEQAETEGDLSLVATFWSNLGAARDESRGPVAGIETYDEALGFCRTHGLPPEHFAGIRLEVLARLGRWDEVIDEAESLRAWTVEHGSGETRHSVDHARAIVRLERGEHTGRLDWLLEEARETGLPATYSAAPAAEAARIEDGPVDAWKVLSDALAATSPGELQWPAMFARACVRAGVAELAREALSLGPVPNRCNAAEMLCAEAMLAESDGDPATGVTLFVRAAEELRELGYVYEQAYALEGLGRCSLAIGETDEGAATLTRSRELWVGMGAAPRVAEVDELLSRRS